MPEKEPVVYDAAVEGLYLRGLRERLTPALKNKLRGVGLELEPKVRPSYPRSIWVEGIKLLSNDLYPGLPPTDAQRKLGELAINGIQHTLMGKPIIAMARMLGPRRAMFRLTQAFGSLNNFMKADVTELGPTHFHVAINDCYGMPSYLEGGLNAVLHLCHKGQFKVVPVEANPPGALFDVTWS